MTKVKTNPQKKSNKLNPAAQSDSTKSLSSQDSSQGKTSSKPNSFASAKASNPQSTQTKESNSENTTKTAQSAQSKADVPITQDTNTKKQVGDQQKTQSQENVQPDSKVEIGGGGTAEAKAGEPKALLDAEPLMPQAPETLSATDQQQIATVQSNAAQVTTQQTNLPDAAANVSEAREGVTEPETETKARAGGDMVAALAAKEPPSPEIEALCEKIKTAIREKRPPDQDSLLQADPTSAAKQAGGQLNSSIQNNADQAQNNYNQLQDTPQGTPQQQAQPINSPPATVNSAPPGAQNAVPTPVPAENVSLDADVKAREDQMQQAGMNSEPAKLVKSGPIAEARAAQGELAETAKEDPAKVLAQQQATLAQSEAEMLALQQNALASLMASRSQTVGNVSTKQQGMVESEEQQRTRIGQEAKTIFETAQKQVDTQLKPLSEAGMKKWNAGVDIASGKFKSRLKKVEDWIKERHAGITGAIVSVWDDVAGYPGWVTEEYNAAEKEFGDEVCNLIRQISSDVNLVIKACEGIIADARQKIDKLFADLPEGLKAWAAGEQARFAEQLDGLQNRAKETRNNFNKELINKASGAVQEVREQIHTLREKAKGILGRLADAVNRFLDDPVKFIIEGLLELVGIQPAAFWALVAKIQQVMKDIADDPQRFANNLMKAIGQGFQQFFDNILKHLFKGFIDWLLSGLKDVGVTLPKDTSIKSIITFFLQIMGITWTRIRKLLVKHVGEKNVALIEKVFSLVSKLIELGPEGIFELIKEKLDPNNIVKMVIDAAIDFMVEALIKQVTARIILLFNPVGAIAQAVEAIYRVLKWVFQNAARIFKLVETVVNAMADVIAGNFGAVANAVEKALSMLIVPVISFLADYAGLGDLPQKIAKVIGKFQDQVEKVLDVAIGWMVAQGKKLLGLGDDKKDPKDHKQIATAAANDLKQGGEELKTYDELRKAKEEQAKQIEQTYQPQLEQGIAIKIHFTEPSQDQKDQDLDFKVVIAPNNEEVEKSISIDISVEERLENVKHNIGKTKYKSILDNPEALEKIKQALEARGIALLIYLNVFKGRESQRTVAVSPESFPGERNISVSGQGAPREEFIERIRKEHGGRLINYNEESSKDIQKTIEHFSKQRIPGWASGENPFHAELKNSAALGPRPIGVSRDLCDKGCPPFYESFSEQAGAAQVIAGKEYLDIIYGRKHIRVRHNRKD